MDNTELSRKNRNNFYQYYVTKEGHIYRELAYKARKDVDFSKHKLINGKWCKILKPFLRGKGYLAVDINGV